MTEIFSNRQRTFALTGNASRACTASVAQCVAAVAHLNRTLDRITRTLVVDHQESEKYCWPTAGDNSGGNTLDKMNNFQCSN